MIDSNSTLLLILKEKNKSTLVVRGKYTTATEKKVNGHFVKVPSKTIKPPEYKTATKAVKLGFAFIENELRIDNNGKSHRPEKPRGNHSRLRFNLWEHWNTMNLNSRLKAICQIYANDQNCELENFEII